MSRRLTRFVVLGTSLVALASLSLAACGSHQTHPEAPDAPPVALTVGSARRASIDELYRTSGTVRGHQTAVLTSKVTGYVKSVAVKAGDEVEAGQVLAVLEASELEAAVRRAQAHVAETVTSRAEADSALEGANSNTTVAGTSRARSETLLTTGAVAKSDFDDVDARYRAAAAQERVAGARVRSSDARIAAAQAELAEAQALLGYAKITAPFAGRVLDRRADPGSLATPGATLLVLEERGGLHVDASIEAGRARSVKIGETATLEVDATTGALVGKVSEIVPVVDVGSRAFVVKIELPPTVTDVQPGTFARAILRVGASQRLVVARSAISASGSLDRVYVVRDGRARLRMVTLGEAQGDVIEVRSGLSDGERVVLAPPTTLRDGARIDEVGK
jgi:RND family efflux transporter MFP subunit